MSKRNLYRYAVAKWGVDAQMSLLQEECAELIVAVSHARRGRAVSEIALCEEMADVLILIEQLRATDPKINEMVGLMKTQKLQRLTERVHNGL